MLYCYYYSVAGYYPARTKRRYLQFIVALTFSIGLYFPANAQVSSTDITSLQSERAQLVEQGLSTREIDQQLFDAAYRPKAIVHTQTLPDGSKRITFPLYLPVSEERKERAIQRLTSAYAYLFSLEINTVTREAAIHVPATVSAEELTAVFDHFGYYGYEEH